MSGKFKINVTLPIPADPGTPPPGNVTIFAQDDNRAYLIDSLANVTKFGAMDNPMIARGDIIVGGSADRLPIGQPGQVITVNRRHRSGIRGYGRGGGGVLYRLTFVPADWQCISPDNYDLTIDHRQMPWPAYDHTSRRR
jgi:hypothetical protein